MHVIILCCKSASNLAQNNAPTPRHDHDKVIKTMFCDFLEKIFTVDYTHKPSFRFFVAIHHNYHLGKKFLP